MSLDVFLSIGVRIVALLYSLYLIRRLRDWRLGALSAMVFLMATRQIATLTARYEAGRPFVWVDRTEIPGLAVSFLTLAAIHFTYRMLLEQRQTADLLRREEAALRDSEGKLRAVLDTIPVRVFWKDEQSTYLGGNRTFAADAGLASASQVAGKRDEDLPWSDASAQLVEEDRAILEKGEGLFGYTGERRTVDGGVIATRASKVPLRNAEGVVAGVLGIYEDVTQLREAQADLERLFAAVEHTSDMIVITDRAGLMTYVNPAFEKTSGYASSECEGRPMTLLRPSSYNETMEKSTLRKLERGETVTSTFRMRTKPDNELTVEVSISPVLDSSGSVSNFVSVLRDVTRERELERQLRQSQKMEAIGALARGIAHDFNNVLQPMIGYAELVRSRVSGDETAERYLDEIARASRRAAELVRQILIAGRDSLEAIGPVNLGSVVNEAAGLIRSSFPPEISIEVDVSGYSGAVLGNATQIHQVIMNLSTNSLHAMEGNDGRLRLSVAEVVVDDGLAEELLVEPGRYARVQIEDTGSGMDPTTLDRAIEPYFTTKPQGKGSGLGLSIVAGIVRSHGGALRLTSRPGLGTTVSVYLPCAATVNAPAGEVAAASASDATGCVMLVDDEASIARLWSEALRTNGFDVREYTDSSEAAAAFAENAGAFDVVLTDYAMPQLGGQAFIDHLRKHRPEIPVIVCTGYGSTAPLSESDANIRVISKPARLDQIVEAVRSSLA